MSSLDLVVAKHPSLEKVIRRLEAMAEGKRWGKVEAVFKNGRVKVCNYTETDQIETE